MIADIACNAAHHGLAVVDALQYLPVYTGFDVLLHGNAVFG
jgi:hypothetical protein